jgi:hypothetical protein
MIKQNPARVKPSNAATTGNAGNARKSTSKPGAKRTPKRTAPRRFALDIGKAISLALMAAKYDWDERIDGDRGAE